MKPMNLSQLVRLACLVRDDQEMGPDPEVFIEDEDGCVWNIEVGYMSEQFDGFETVYPAAILLRKRDLQ